MKTPDSQQTAALAPLPCYALRLFTYDYYEWQQDYAASFDPEMLKEHHKTGLDGVMYRNAPLVDESEHAQLADSESPHWVVTPIRFLHNRD